MHSSKSLGHIRNSPSFAAIRWTCLRWSRPWQVEFAEFLADIEQHREPSAGLEAARRALVVAEEIYLRSGFRFAATAKLELERTPKPE